MISLFKKKEGGGIVAETRDPLLPSEGALPPDPLGEPARERLRGKAQAEKVSPSSRVGRPSKNVAPVPLTPDQEEQLARYKDAVATLYNPRSWARVACAPFDAMLLVTGAKEFDLAKEEREDLGEDVGLCLQFYGNVNPGILALIKTGADLSSIFAAHWMMYRARLLREELAHKPAEGLKSV